MSSMNSSTNSLDYLVTLQEEIAKWMLSIILVIGHFSNYANIFVFLQRGLRVNPCSWYFIAVSVGHLIFFYFGCLPRVVTNWTGFDLTRTSIIFCKIRPYFLACALLISRHFLCLISIDRWLITSRQASLRQWSSLKTVKWVSLISIIVWLLFSISMPIWYRIETNRGCVGASDSAFPLFFAIYNLATILIPLAVMLVFNTLICMNFRRRNRSRVSAQTESTAVVIRGTNFHRKDHQLIKLSLIQSLVYIALTSIYAYSGTYSFFTLSIPKTREQRIIDGFVSSMGINLMYLYMAMTFFLYTLVSKTFRQEFILACRRTYRKASLFL